MSVLVASGTRDWDAAADGWHTASPVLRPWLASATRMMFSVAGVAEGHHVLDVAAGAGDQTLQLAERVGPQGRILATDLSPRLLAHLVTSAARAGHANIATRAVDGQLPLEEADYFDGAISRLGIMLMPEPGRCLHSVHRALKPGAQFAALVFAGPQDNPCLEIVMETALRHAGLGPRDPGAAGGLMSLGRPGLLDSMFEAAGFRNVATFRIEAPFHVPSVGDYVAFLKTSAAPVIAILSRLGADAREAAWGDMSEKLARYTDATGWTGPNTLLLTAGRKP